MVVKTVPRSARVDGLIDAPPSELQQMEDLVMTRSADQLYNLLNMLIRGESEIKRAGDAWIALELLVLRMANAPDFVELSKLIRRLEAEPPARSESISRRSAGVPISQHSDVRSVGNKAPAPASEPAPADKIFSGEEADGRSERPATSGATCLPSERPDEIWSVLKDRIEEWGGDPALRSIMDHGNLIAFGPKEVEIGFTRSLYKEDFEKRLAGKQELQGIFREYFGSARLKILTLSRETSLASEKPYGVPADGQTDLDRALKHEARDNPITRAVLDEFEGSAIEEVRVIGPKP